MTIIKEICVDNCKKGLTSSTIVDIYERDQLGKHYSVEGKHQCFLGKSRDTGLDLSKVDLEMIVSRDSKGYIKIVTDGTLGAIADIKIRCNNTRCTNYYNNLNKTNNG